MQYESRLLISRLRGPNFWPISSKIYLCRNFCKEIHVSAIIRRGEDIDPNPVFVIPRKHQKELEPRRNRRSLPGLPVRERHDEGVDRTTFHAIDVITADVDEVVPARFVIPWHMRRELTTGMDISSQRPSFQDPKECGKLNATISGGSLKSF
jgi:hypothetical protein